MATLCCFSGLSALLPLNSQFQFQLRRSQYKYQGVHYQCFSNSNTPRTNIRSRNNNTQTPQILKMAVSAVTELLRLFSSSQKSGGTDKQTHEFPVSSVHDVLMIIKSDYDNAYFVTGNFTSSIYAENCIFEDPTIKFRVSGSNYNCKDISLLNCIVSLKHTGFMLRSWYKLIMQDIDFETNFVLATWKLRTNLKLPWRPLISIDGSTLYELDEEFKIVRHVESWNVSAVDAILQIFTFKFDNSRG